MVKYPLGTYWTIVAFAVFLLAPAFPKPVLKMLSGNIVGNFLMVGAVVAASRVSIAAVLATFLAVAAVYVEYRKRIIHKLMLVTPPKTASAGKMVAPNETINEKIPPKTQNGSVAEDTHFYQKRGLV